jgi:hypothetical protein
MKVPFFLTIKKPRARKPGADDSIFDVYILKINDNIELV